MEQESKREWNWWMYTKQYDTFLRIIRPLTLLVAVGALIYLFKNIETAKLLLNNPCEICMNKTGATCFYLGG